jgi:hypothetical protein
MPDHPIRDLVQDVCAAVAVTSFCGVILAWLAVLS